MYIYRNLWIKSNFSHHCLIVSTKWTKMKNESNSSNSELNNVTESVVESSSNESKFDAYHYYGIHSINNNNNTNNINSNNFSNSKSGKYHNRYVFILFWRTVLLLNIVNRKSNIFTFFSSSLNATDDESVAELFRPGRQSLENYDLKLAHQRYNVAYDKFLGVNNVKAGIELFANIKDEGFMESLAWAACHCIRASLTLDKVSIVYHTLLYIHTICMKPLFLFFYFAQKKQKKNFNLNLSPESEQIIIRFGNDINLMDIYINDSIVSERLHFFLVHFAWDVMN